MALPTALYHRGFSGVPHFWTDPLTVAIFNRRLYQGYYLPAEAATAHVQKLTDIMEERVDGKLSTLDDKLSTLTQLVSQKMITAEPDISEWPTPAQRIASLNLSPVEHLVHIDFRMHCTKIESLKPIPLNRTLR